MWRLRSRGLPDRGARAGLPRLRAPHAGRPGLRRMDQARRSLAARLRRSDRDRRRGVPSGCRARLERRVGEAHRGQPDRPGTGDRCRPHGLFQGPAAALRGLWPPAGTPSRAPPQGPLSPDLPALARGGRRVPQAPDRARPVFRPHQRPLLRVRLDAAALQRARSTSRHHRRPLSAGTHRPGDAAARRHEPGRQGNSSAAQTETRIRACWCSRGSRAPRRSSPRR